MSKKRNPSFWKRMHLIDRCLLLFMLLLISQSVYNLFAHEIAYEDASSLDSALRTTTSGIFGYFISGGTMPTAKSKKEDEEEETLQPTPSIPIGFQATSPSPSMTAATEKEPAVTPAVIPSSIASPPSAPPSSTPISATTSSSKTANPWGQQVIIVTLIGLISLTILLVARNFAVLNTTTIATLSQFRDFTSGSVGFLIGRANGNES